MSTEMEVDSDFDVSTIQYDGIKTCQELNDFLEKLEQVETIYAEYLQVFLNTKNFLVVKSMSQSFDLGGLIVKFIDKSIDPWRDDILLLLIRILDSIPFHYDVLVKNKLGLKLQSLRKLAASKKSARVVMNINYLVQKWKEMEKPKKTVLGKRDAPSISPPPEVEIKIETIEPAPTKKEETFKPSERELTPNEEEAEVISQKKFRLAIEKDPPTKPSFSDSSTTEFSNGYRIIRKSQRPIYYVDQLLEKLELIEHPPSPPPDKAKPHTKKSVTFKENIAEIRFYDFNPEEWTTFTDIERYYSTPWVTPPLIDFSSNESKLAIRKQLNSYEVAHQEKRESTTLAVTYISDQHIPPTPAAPDKTSNPNPDGSVFVIPIVLNPNASDPRITKKAPLSVKESFKMKPVNKKTRPTSTPIFNKHEDNKMSAKSKRIRYRKSKSCGDISLTSTSLHRRSLSTDTPTDDAIPITSWPPSPPPTTTTLNKALNVQTMLQCNPDILASLKQLSVLAQGTVPLCPPKRSFPNNKKLLKALKKSRANALRKS